MLKNKLYSICLYAFWLRIVALIIVCNFSHLLTTGYLRSTMESDDLRYEAGALIYSQNAQSIVDIGAYVDAYLIVGDSTGLSDSIEIWYWILCVLMFIFHDGIVVKVINIIIGVGCVALIYKLCKLTYPDNGKIAEKAAKLYAFFPYPVFFSCFLYKDQFLTLIILSIIYIVYKYDSIFTIKRLLSLSFLLAIFTMIRSGLLPILIVCIGLILLKKSGRKIALNLRTITLLLIAAVISYYLFKLYAEVIAHKLEAYVLGRVGSADLKDSSIQYFLINNVWDAWKLPFSFVFTLVQPLYTGGRFISWESFISVLNIVFIPVVIGNFVYMFKKSKGDSTLWLAMMLLYAVMLIVSMGVGRHFYYLLPFPIIFYADYVYRFPVLASNTKKVSFTLAYIYLLLVLIPSLI